MGFNVDNDISDKSTQELRQRAKKLWLFPGLWIGIGALISIAWIFDTTVSNVIGIDLSEMPFYHLSVIYRSSLPLVHILAPIFLLFWVLQGYFMLSKPNKNNSYAFMGFNAFSFIIWIFSFWEAMNGLILLVLLAIFLSLFYSVKIFPWEDSLRIRTLQNLNSAEKIAKDTNKELQRKSDSLSEILKENQIYDNPFSRSLESFKYSFQDLLSKINYSKEQLEKASSDPEYMFENSKELLRNAQNFSNEPIYQQCENEFTKTIEEVMNKKIENLLKKLEVLNEKYNEELLNLPSELIEIHSPYGANSTINKVLLRKDNIIESLKNKEISEISLKKFLEFYSLIDERLNQIDEYILENNQRKRDITSSLERKIYELKKETEGFRISEIIDKFNIIRLKPVENKLKALEVQNNSLLFENEISKLNLFESELNDISEEIGFIITLFLMDKGNEPLSTLGKLNAKQKRIISDEELNIKKYLKNTDLSDYLLFETSEEDKKITLGNKNNRKDTFEKLERIKPILLMVREEIENYPKKYELEIDCDSEEIAEFLCEFISKNSPNVVCDMAGPENITTVIDFSNCETGPSVEVTKLLNVLYEKLDLLNKKQRRV